jgi:hypothetical protein
MQGMPRPQDAREGIPAVKRDARLGLAVASVDLQPLALVVAPDATTRASLESKVAALAWTTEMRGRFAYASVAGAGNLRLTGGSGLKSGVILIEPDLFGVRGVVVKEVAAADVDVKLAAAMRDTIAAHQPPGKSREQLRRLALQQGTFFETGIPVSGKKEAEDREKFRKQLQASGRALGG